MKNPQVKKALKFLVFVFHGHFDCAGGRGVFSLPYPRVNYPAQLKFQMSFFGNRSRLPLKGAMRGNLHNVIHSVAPPHPPKLIFFTFPLGAVHK